MKTLYVIFAALLLSAAWYLGANSGNSNTTENYASARYALIEAEINISNVMNSGGLSNNVQKSLFKLDTVTGRVWVLQLALNGTGDPTVRSAVWAQVQDSGIFFPNGNPQE